MPVPVSPGGMWNYATGQSMFNLLGIPASPTLKSDGAVPTSVESGLNSYVAAFSAFTPVATPTAFMVLVGSATKTVKIRRVEFNVTSDSAVATTLDARITKRSSAGTLGSAVLTALTAAPTDSGPAVAATGVASSVGTANYTTLGTSVGILAIKRILAVLATRTATNFPALDSGIFLWTPGSNGEAPCTLRGVAEQITLDLNGGTLTGTCVFSGYIVFTEESTSY